MQFDPAASMRIEGGDPQDDLVGNRFEDSGPADVTLFGLPYDGAVIGRKGARLGPAAIRAQLRKLKHPAGPARWRDLGDVRMPDGPVEAGETARTAMKAALAAGGFPVALGGDHSLTYGLVRGVVDTLGEASVLNLDAHLDVRIASPPNSGTSFRRLVEDKVVDATRIAEVGIRPFANSPNYFSWARRSGIHLVEADRLDLLERALAALPDPLYVSLDIDVLDETAAPGVSAPTPGGLTTAQLFGILRALRERRVVAMDVVETCPPLDVDDRTARAAACAILSLVASRT